MIHSQCLTAYSKEEMNKTISVSAFSLGFIHICGLELSRWQMFPKVKKTSKKQTRLKHVFSTENLHMARVYVCRGRSTENCIHSLSLKATASPKLLGHQAHFLEIDSKLQGLFLSLKDLFSKCSSGIYFY